LQKDFTLRTGFYVYFSLSTTAPEMPLQRPGEAPEFPGAVNSQRPKTRRYFSISEIINLFTTPWHTVRTYGSMPVEQRYYSMPGREVQLLHVKRLLTNVAMITRGFPSTARNCSLKSQQHCPKDLSNTVPCHHRTSRQSRQFGPRRPRRPSPLPPQDPEL